jgi:hypothetical protein
VARRHLDVGDGHVRPPDIDEAHQSRGVLGGPGDLEAGLYEQPGEALPVPPGRRDAMGRIAGEEPHWVGRAECRHGTGQPYPLRSSCRRAENHGGSGVQVLPAVVLADSETYSFLDQVAQTIRTAHLKAASL